MGQKDLLKILQFSSKPVKSISIGYENMPQRNDSMKGWKGRGDVCVLGEGGRGDFMTFYRAKRHKPTARKKFCARNATRTFFSRRTS